MNELLEKLLHDAKIARDAAMMAYEDRNGPEHHRLRQKARNLERKAEKLDPQHLSPCWCTHA